MSALRRREFLHRALMATAGSAAFGSMLGKLELAQAAVPRTLLGAGSNYKALVCLYLYGGNDCFNMVVPRDGAHAQYAQTRGSLAVPQGQLLSLSPTTPPQGGGLYGLHPQMVGTQQMFNAGRAAIVANVARWSARSTSRAINCRARRYPRNYFRTPTRPSSGRPRAPIPARAPAGAGGSLTSSRPATLTKCYR